MLKTVSTSNAPKIHESALDRIKVGAHLYAPIGLPATYDMVTYDRTIVSGANTYGFAARAAVRADDQEMVWNFVWQRRAIYFLTVFTSLYLAAYPLARASGKSSEYSTPLRLLSDTFRVAGSVLPEAASPWLDFSTHAIPVNSLPLRPFSCCSSRRGLGSAP